MMKASELRNKTVKDLEEELTALFKEQFNLRIQRGVGQKPQPHLFKNVRRSIARLKTVLREKEGSAS